MNEAAERLRAYITGDDGRRAPLNGSYLLGAVDAALAAERRATVERIRAAIVAQSGAYDWTADEAAVGAEIHDNLFAILDAEASHDPR